MAGERRVGETVHVHDRMQSGYSYAIAAPAGRDFAHRFSPSYAPKQMLALGVFEGKYCNDCRGELPADWYDGARIGDAPDPALNCFGVKSRQPLSVWRENGWIYGPDPRGWFQWYCRYYRGRRLPQEDRRQIARWQAMRRHARQIERNCDPCDHACRPRQRQALLHWAYDSRKI